MRRAALLILASALALGATPAPSDELVVAEWISTGSHVEKHVLQPMRGAFEYLRVDPQGQTATSAVRLLSERLVNSRKTMGSIRDSLQTFQKGLATEPSRQFCEKVGVALGQATTAIDSASLVVADMKRDSTKIQTLSPDLGRQFQTINKLTWNTDLQRAQVLEAAERIRAARR